MTPYQRYNSTEELSKRLNKNTWKKCCAFCREPAKLGTKHQCKIYLQWKEYYTQHCDVCGMKLLSEIEACDWCREHNKRIKSS